MDLNSLLIQFAREEGFPLAGSVDLDLALHEVDPEKSFQTHIQKYDNWIQAGYSGSMEYLVRGRDRRADPRLLFPEAQSIFCVAIPYSKLPIGAETPSQGPRYARYLQGKDYHLEIPEKLERVMQKAKEVYGASLQWKICVDSSAVLERSWAALAGLGWIGKNTLLIHPQYGSYLFLAEVLMNQKTGRGPSPLPNYCGNCTRCLEACPTQAFTKPRVLDSNRCISYWTLEKRGPLDLSEDDKKKIGPWVAGCDICQEVCPFNRKPTQLALKEGDLNSAGAATELQDWKNLLLESSESYRSRVKESALKRVKPEQFSRNLAVSLLNSIQNDPAAFSTLRNELMPLVETRYQGEINEAAKAEWKRCLEVLDSDCQR